MPHATITPTTDINIVARIRPAADRITRHIEQHLQVLHDVHPASASHCRRVGRLAQQLARALGWREDRVADAFHAGLLHDIGKAAIDTTLLDAPRALTASERAHVDRHAALGATMLKGDAMLGHLVDPVARHHDRFDTHGIETPLIARLVAVVDVWDAMTSPRPYAATKSDREAGDELDRCAGTQFDPVLVDAFLELVERPRLRLIA